MNTLWILPIIDYSKKFIQLAYLQPNIFYLIRIISQIIIKQQIFYLIATKHILRYITSILNYNIFHITKSRIIISSYINLDWIRDLYDGQLTINFVFMVEVNPITWSSKK